VGIEAPCEGQLSERDPSDRPSRDHRLAAHEGAAAAPAIRTRPSAPMLPRHLTLLVWLSAAVLIAGIWLATMSQLGFERTSVIASAIRENQNNAIAYQQYVTRTLEAADFAAVHLASRFEDLADAPGAAPRAIDDRIAANPMFVDIDIVDRHGQVRWTTAGTKGPTTLAGTPLFRAAREGRLRNPAVTGSAFGVRPAVIDLTRRIVRPDGSFGGLVIVRMPVRRLTDFTEGASLRPLDMTSVIGLDGFTMARRTGTIVSYGEDLRGKLVMKRQLAHPIGTYLGPSALDGVPRFFSHHRLSSYPVFVTVGIAERDVLRDTRRRSTWTKLGAGVLTLLLVAIAALATAALRRRDRAAAALAEANRRLHEAQRIGRMGNWEYDPRARTITWSDQLSAMYGRDPGDPPLSEEQALAYFDADDRETLEHAIAEAIRTNAPQICEVVARADRGETSVRRISLMAVGEGDCPKIIGTDQDVSDEKIHEQIRDEMAHLSRIEAMNMMAMTVAHELAQPLTAAANYVSGAKIYARRRRPEDFDALAEALVLVEQQIGLAGDIMRRAREMVARKPKGSRCAFLPDAVEDAITLVRIANDQAELDIVFECDDEAPFVAADKVQLQQVLMNLLRNAAEATAGQAQARIAVKARRIHDGSILVCVEDNGPGITDDLASIFAPFKTGKARGLGLGLSISRTIIQSFRGRMWVNRSPEGGAAISFTLPAATPA
jgi:signal transduction histidine kinase